MTIIIICIDSSIVLTAQNVSCVAKENKRYSKVIISSKIPLGLLCEKEFYGCIISPRNEIEFKDSYQL